MPFLDKEFMDVAMRLDPEAKMVRGEHNMEKWVLRKAFEDMLPESIVWRQKEQFSDGVGYGWIDTLKKVTSEAVSDRDMSLAAERFPINPPRNKEEYYYRTIFEEPVPVADGGAVCAFGAFGGMFHGRGSGVGRVVQEHERSFGPRCVRRAREGFEALTVMRFGSPTCR